MSINPWVPPKERAPEHPSAAHPDLPTRHVASETGGRVGTCHEFHPETCLFVGQETGALAEALKHVEKITLET